MRESWWERFLDGVADRGRDRLKLNASRDPVERVGKHCEALLTSVGEASGTALAREVARELEALDDAARLHLLQTLNVRFGPDREAILRAADAYRTEPSLETFLALSRAIEPPRQELFRRINRAPGGTRTLVHLRAHVLRLLPEHPELGPVDADLLHLLGSWFNPGFLRLERIDFRTPANLLEKIINYESVHAIGGWDDLRRRLQADRRCFGFFHPALPEEPLIFVEVALLDGVPTAAAPLLDPSAPVADPARAHTAVFYSINNCQYGLRGVSFGNFLIKQVISELLAEFPRLDRLVTLSPVPGLADAVRRAHDGGGPLGGQGPRRLLADHVEPLRQASGEADPLAALLQLLQQPRPDAHGEILAKPLERLTLAYLTRAREGGRLADPVARFHLANGARLEQIDAFADLSERRMAQSFGVMVNYRYVPGAVEHNHERYMADGQVVLARPLRRELRRLEQLWPPAEPART
ncbi:MAG: malonyl-CoA decarboxylase [Gammaproteobacteria bacterium]|nr:malonyl-CoA decarboxylase [Gammaproteobacteria bacterium]NIR85006.1 malonyl-CoA decarboxylase [Gammaproteobacteria bacterium]NIR88273.1 malonyl-CoA decarboxylase [Gammaproteobacteria bacterium]NIU06053.1 malonyl-CoA decarboxylase [Gammaproteobacteria bacterium]NIV73472.1 Malonyl-CoA decarboxylase [Gammaproteobacteria bacterium]